ncbi:MAG: ribosome-binding factor A [Halobacteriovoraceae bacterium]|nr:ribosome-binding factor A [Halobacteriovoraceae bacterium]|tara:strand:+ start:20432 stop:20788 length:357 start_codon:yes stop_codon:yes gene_type:complete
MARKSGSHNKSMFEERIKNEMNSFLRTELKDPRLMLMSITRVELNQDYSVASVYWDTFDSSKRGDIKSALEGTKGRLRSLLAKNLKVRHTPELNFSYDSQFEDERKIENLLKDNPSGE